MFGRFKYRLIGSQSLTITHGKDEKYTAKIVYYMNDFGWRRFHVFYPPQFTKLVTESEFYIDATIWKAGGPFPYGIDVIEPADTVAEFLRRIVLDEMDID